MAVNNSIIDEILSRVDIVDVISRYVPLKRSGSNLSGCCPFHNEKTPSFMVSPQKQIFKCFGCGIGGNVFKFVEESEKVDFRDAVKLLAEQNHIDIAQYQTSTAYQEYSKDEKEKMKRMHKLAQQFFVDSLEKSPEAMQYLTENRKLDITIIKEFGVGYASDKHYELLSYLRNKGFNDEDMVQASLAKKNLSGDVYAFFRNRITFPIYDLMKNVVGFSARVINPEDQPKYLNSTEHKAFEKSKILYGLSHAKPYINKFQKLIVVEGQMDVIALARIDFPIGVATSGTALSEEHIKIVKRHTENFYFLFDNDKAGQQASFRALKLCYNQDIFPKIISLPEGCKDIDDVANLENGKQLFETALEQAHDGFLVMFEKIRTNSDMTSPIDKQKLINAMFELIISVGNVTIQEHYKGLLAEKLGFATEIINVQLQKYKSGEGKIFLKQQQRQRQQTQPEHYQPNRELLFSSLFQDNFLSKCFSPSEGEISEGQRDSLDDFMQTLTSFAKQITIATPQSYLARVFRGELTDPEKEEINEIQLRREKELHNVEDTLTKKAIIQRVIAPNIQEYFKIGTKSQNLSNEEKMELNTLKIQIGKK
ncbi:MAG: DNA primase [Candidatus Absconditabacteria bacterium]|nr:DNA primase [Candidatus Absconditabacteria bacterium]MDD3868323.1 DNA primase [Candidatus Absconditabacteria bacterium]MDD4713987.1 DNA primase [Candidatus Absconditabacteria bacterium]